MFQPGAFQPNALQVGSPDAGTQAGFVSLALLGLPGGMGANVASGAYSITGNVGSATITGQSATLLRSRYVGGTAGTATAAGLSATLTRSYTVVATAGAATAAGASATLLRSKYVGGTAGTATAAGASATLSRSYTVVATAGTATAAGASATLSRSYTIVATAGTATAAGVSATLTYTPAFGSYTLTGLSGSVVLAGSTADLMYVPLPSTAPPVGHVGVRGRGRTRVWVEIRNGQVYEVSDEAEAKKVVRAIKRKAVRQAAQAARNDAPPPEAPEVTVRGEVNLLPDLRREIGDIKVDMARVYERIALDRLRQQEDDDEEAIIALFM